MSSEMQPARTPMGMIIAGWIIGGLPALMMLAGSFFAFRPPSPDSEAMARHLGWQPSSAPGQGLLMVFGALLYLFPRTAPFGAIVLTGYLGGALATHVRVNDPFVPTFVIPFALAVALWFGLLLRDERVRAILPWRTPADPDAPPGGCLAALAKIVLTVVLLVLVLAGLVAAVPAEFEVTRSLTIDAPPAEVFAHVNDLHKFDAWQPWKKYDKDAKITYEGAEAGTGAVYKWVGNDDVGEGMMTITESTPDVIKIKLQFLKPFEATNDTQFTFKADGNKTVVTWTITGERDPKMKAICVVLNMDKMLGDQFDEGLNNLKAIVEKK
jgi:hypothetical protein